MTQQPMPGAVPQWTISDRLRKAREYAGLDQAQFADEVGISRRSVTNYEKGHSQPSRPVLLAWSLRTGVAMEWLANGGDDGLPRLDSNQRPSDYTSAGSGIASLLHLRRDRRSARRARQLVPAIEVAA